MKKKEVTAKRTGNAAELRSIPVFKRIGFKLSIFFICSILIIGIFSLLYIPASYHQVIKHSNEERSSMAFVTMETVLDEYKKNSEKASKVLAEDEKIIDAVKRGSTSAIRTAVELAAKNKDQNVDIITVTDNKGNVLARTYSDSTGDSVVEQKCVLMAIDGKTTSEIGVESEIKLSARAGTPIKDDSGKIIGVILAGYSLSNTDFVDKLKSMTGSEFTVFFGDERLNTTIMDKGERVVGTKLDPKIAKIVIEEKQTYLGEASILGMPYATIYKPILDDKENAIGAFFSGISLESVNSASQSAFYTSVLVEVTFMIVIMIVLVSFIRRSIAKPLFIMSEVATDLSYGKLDIELKYESENELGILANALRSTVKSLKSYIYDISESLDQMSKGDMRVSIELDYDGDFKAIKDAIQKISDNLNQTLLIINSAADEVNSGAEQVSSTSQALASGAAMQAASVEELNASIASVSQQADENVINVHKAAEYVEQAGLGVEISNTHMQKLNNSMSEIGLASEKISGITKVIEDIAFQTNILALNAAIEAARAGNAGKGFSVVADEVRNLASKSAEAARQTSDLIQYSVITVSEGEKMATQTAQVLKDVTEKAKLAVESIHKIEEASSEQAKTMEQIAKGVLQVSEVVQANAATAEESSAASEELAAQAQTMQNEVKRFKLNEEVTAHLFKKS